MKRKGAIKVKNLHRYRQLMPYLMPTRNESIVYFDTYVKAEKLLEFLQQLESHPQRITLTHLLIYACSVGFYHNSEMNRYVSGHALYQREKAEVAFSIKKEMARQSPLKTVKMTIEDGESLEEIARRINERLTIERSDKKTYTDKEISLVTLLPRPLLKMMVALTRWLDYHNLLPDSFTANDPLHASIFIANVGSIDMDPFFHHLYEYGTTSIFLTAGKIKDMAIVEEGESSG